MYFTGFVLEYQFVYLYIFSLKDKLISRVNCVHCDIKNIVNIISLRSAMWTIYEETFYDV